MKMRGEANAPLQVAEKSWMPACAGMTGWGWQ